MASVRHVAAAIASRLRLSVKLGRKHRHRQKNHPHAAFQESHSALFLASVSMLALEPFPHPAALSVHSASPDAPSADETTSLVI